MVGEAADGFEALSATEALHPDVVVMDLNLPRLDGVEAIRELRVARPEIEVVALAGTVEEERVMAAIEAGAAGFLLKDAGPDDVAAAIRAARNGEMYLAPAVAGIVARQLRAPGGPVTARRRVVAHHRASATSSGWSPKGSPIGPSARPSESPNGPPGRTSRTSSPSWA